MKNFINQYKDDIIYFIKINILIVFLFFCIIFLFVIYTPIILFAIAILFFIMCFPYAHIFVIIGLIYMIIVNI